MCPVRKNIWFVLAGLALFGPLCVAANCQTPADAGQGKAIEPVVATGVTAGDSRIAGRHGEVAGKASQAGNAAKALLTPIFSRLPKFMIASGGECKAGGAGATSCSYGDCTVPSGTCKDGNYPCCGADVCGCSSGAENL